MRGVVHQSDLAKEVQDAFPTEDKLSCRIAYLYSESASSVQKLKAIYEDERVGFDLSARAELAALKCQLALHQAGGTCAWSKSCYHFHPFSFSLFVIIFCCGFMFILVSQSSLGFRLHFGPQVLWQGATWRKQTLWSWSRSEWIDICWETLQQKYHGQSRHCVGKCSVYCGLDGNYQALTLGISMRAVNGDFKRCNDQSAVGRWKRVVIMAWDGNLGSSGCWWGWNSQTWLRWTVRGLLGGTFWICSHQKIIVQHSHAFTTMNVRSCEISGRFSGSTLFFCMGILIVGWKMLRRKKSADKW